MLDQRALSAGLAADLVGEVEGVALQVQAVAGQAWLGVDLLLDLLGGLTGACVYRQRALRSLRK